MEAEQAYQLLSDYLLLGKNENGLARIFEIQEIYEKYRPCLTTSSSPLTKRISNVLEACSTIERSFQLEAERVLEVRNKLGDDESGKEYRKLIDDMDRDIIAQAGRPLPPCPEIENHPAILEIYKKYNARTITQKSNAIEKESGSKPGEIHIHVRGDWREPKWKLKQLKLRALAQVYLIERRFVDVKYC